MLAGRQDIPVAAGLDQPMSGLVADDLNPDETPNQYMEDMAAEWTGYSGNAVDFILEKAETEPDGITLLAIGPLTNIAAALQKKPDVRKRIKRIVLMGGAYFMPVTDLYHCIRLWGGDILYLQVVNSNIRVCSEVDSESFIRRFMRRLLS